jgi:DNA-binding response OmpR family regulator
MRDLYREGAQYGAADVLLFDGVPPNRGTTRSALNTLGFKKITATSDWDEAAHSVSQRSFDVLIADLAVESERTCRLVREIRQGDIGNNPFLVVLLTTWGVREDRVDNVMGSGADDVLIRPYSVSFLAERVRAHIEARKDFVVTADYIGPNRRKASARPSNVRALEVPNTLRLKVRPHEAGANTHDVESMVRAAQSKVEEMRLVGCALQMRLLAHFALKAVEDGGALDKYLGPMSSFSRLLFDKLHESSDAFLADAVGATLESTASVMQGENVIAALAQSADQAKVIHQRLGVNRDALDLEKEFQNAIKRLGEREAESLRERLISAR